MTPAALATLLLLQAGLLPVGAARVDITPDHPVRLSGYAARKTESAGVESRIFARGLALGEGRDAAVLLSVELAALPAALVDEVAARIERKTGIPRERFTVCVTHTHSAPWVAGAIPLMFGAPVPEAELANVARYSRELVPRLEQAALDALAARQPGTLRFGQGRADFARNRRTPGGPVDPSVPTLAAAAPDGTTCALVFGYACHCTTLGSETNAVCGDWAGFAAAALEAAHPGCVALPVIGCGGDANPHPRPGVAAAQQHGRSLAAEVDRVLAGAMTAVAAGPTCRFARIQLPFAAAPSRSVLEERGRQQTPVGHHARVQLDRLDRGEPPRAVLPYPVQSWVFGEQLAIVFLGGEVVVDYALRLKWEFDPARLWVCGYSNDVACYIPSRRILQEGGYEAEGAMTYYDQPARLVPAVEDQIVRTVRGQLPEALRTEAARAEFPAPRSAADSLACLASRPELKVELVASEPLVEDPVAIDWGTDGALWVAEMRDYPNGIDGAFAPGGRVRRVTDQDGDGTYDTATVFLDGLAFPTGVTAWKKGVLVCAAPDVLYAEDRDGDGKADVREVILHGFGTDNFQARVNSLTLGLDHWIYGANGLIGGRVRGPAGGLELDLGNRDFRFRPEGRDLEPAAGLSQQGRVRDEWGNWFGCDAGGLLFHFPLPDHCLRRNPHFVPPDPRVYVPADPDSRRLFPRSRSLARFNDPGDLGRVTSACGVEMYRDDLLGPGFRGNAFTCEPVHNLVHREVLTPNGATFVSHRAADEQDREFLASTDPWFRPVQARTGPDGALWVVDMYRHVIEHPRWIPADRLLRLDLRAGEGMGRIWRVVPKERALRPRRDLTKLAAPELTALLREPNGVVRDQAHRELFHRQDRGAVPELQRVAETAALPQGRAQALCALEGLGALTHAVVLRALSDPDPGVRGHAVRLAEPLQTKSLPIASRLFALAQDAEASVRFQVALSLGAWNDALDAPLAAAALAAILERDVADRWLMAAVLSACGPRSGLAPRVLAVVMAHGPRTWAVAEASAEILRSHLAGGGSEDAVTFLCEPGPGGERRLPLMAVLGEPTHSRRLLFVPQSDADRAWEVVAASRDPLPDPASDPGRALRFAIPLLPSLDHEARVAELAVLRTFLGAGVAEQYRAPALARLAESRSGVDEILAMWRELTPALRSRMLDRCMGTIWGRDGLCAAIRAGHVPATELDAARRERLLASVNPVLRRNVADLLDVRPPAARAEALAKFQPALTFTGDRGAGARHFDKLCAQCHELRGRGFAVGPDLAALGDRSSAALFTAILDPNRAVEARYSSYRAELQDGRSFTGVLGAETGTSLTVLMANGVREQVLRKDLKSLQGSQLSLMPEGLEDGLSPQDLADLIAFVQSGPTRLGSTLPQQEAQARERFREQGQSGLARVLASREVFQQPSWLGRVPMHYCRQTDGSWSVRWETAPLPEKLAAGGRHAFRFAAAMGLRSQRAGGFHLALDGREALTFDVALDDATWQSADGKVRMSFAVQQNNAEDATGIVVVEVSHELLTPGKPVVFEVRGAAAGSDRWFGVLECPAK